MLKIRRKLLLNQLNKNVENQIVNQKHSNILKWIKNEIDQFQYNLVDQNADFYINEILKEQKKLIVVEIYIKPKRGIFNQIQFRPKLYFSCIDLINRPKIYNDRRIFHPNINIETLQILYPELVVEWSPTKKLKSLLLGLKYLMIEPNISFIPNTELNKKAGLNYHFRRNHYRELVFQNMPLVFQNLQTNFKNDYFESSLQLEKYSSQSSETVEKEWIDVRLLFPTKISGPRIEFSIFGNEVQSLKRSFLENEWIDEEQIQMLAKQMKKVHVISDTEGQTLMEIQ